jgi:hypothetical protein
MNFTSTTPLLPKFIPLPPDNISMGNKDIRHTHELMSEACRILAPRFLVREQTRELIRQAVQVLIGNWSINDLGTRSLTFRKLADTATRIAREQGERTRSVCFQTIQAITAHWDVMLPAGDIQSFRELLFSKAGKQVYDNRGFNIRQSAYEDDILLCISRDPGASARTITEKLRKKGILVSLRKVNKDMLILMDKLVRDHLAARPTATKTELESYLERRGFRLTSSRRERIVAAMPGNA